MCDQRAEELLNWVDVQQGDMLYVAAGTVHTIGGGMVLVETQQTCDITYRLYDYGRPRELHIAEGLAATKLHTNAGKVVRYAGDPSEVLVRSPFFQVEKIRLRDLLRARRSLPLRRKLLSQSMAPGWLNRRAWLPSVSRPEKLLSSQLRCANTRCVRSGSSRSCAWRCLQEQSQSRRRCWDNLSPRDNAIELVFGWEYDLSKVTFYPVILAGGRGTRFWPLSRKRMAKQLLPLNSEKSMIQETVERLLPLAKPQQFWVITNSDLRDAIVRQLKDLDRKQIIAEPVGRNTAPGDWTGSVSAGAPRSHGRDRDVPFRPRYREREALP